ncbi:ultraviolet-B receptor UVR8-like isoform X1 [Hibiscus syriacus]|uniref:Conserved oligomeric Golgi complex subunit 7 n=1 Tax=Hibiscus syriacus TaxID=106335 RepID=A0A6A2X6L7_HIBSY|nr:ultraviolet-B receptor UVR8-like isoform X1 [Hibiscus syriacus]
MDHQRSLYLLLLKLTSSSCEWKLHTRHCRCMFAFPDDYKSLVPKLLTETMAALGSSFVSRINLATGEVVPEMKALAKGILDILSGDLHKGSKIQTKHLEALIDLHNMTVIFARNIQHLFSESDLRVLMDTLKAVYFPYESFKQRYGHMERAILSSEIAGADLRGAVSRGVGAQGIELSETVRRMEESIPQVILHLEAAVERCMSFTGGSEADELILALDIMLQSSVFEASLRATLARLSTIFSLSAFGLSLEQNQLQVANDDGNREEPPLGGRAALDVAAVRLVDVPDKSRKLLDLLDQSKDPRFHPLPLASQRVYAFAESVNELVYDVLISKVRQYLSDVSCVPIWSAAEEQSAFHLPTFSAYPQSYVTSVGEYLLTLPQQLEPLAEGISNSDANNDEAQFFATEWMFKVAEGATALYMEQLRGIQYITDRGAQQLSVDIEYLSSVLSALSIPIPPVLATFQTCLGSPRHQLKDLLKSDNGNQLDLPTANLVCKIRRRISRFRTTLKFENNPFYVPTIVQWTELLQLNNICYI